MKNPIPQTAKFQTHSSQQQLQNGSKGFAPPYCKSNVVNFVFFTLLLMFMSFPAKSQSQLNFFEAWYATGGEADNFFNNIVSVTDGDNNVYVAASTLNEYDHYDLLITKYDRYGVEVWSDTYNETSSGDAVAGGITLDGSGNVIVTGTVYISAANYDLYVIKYTSSGTFQWSETYDGTYSVYDGGKALICDGSDNIYVTGGTFESATHSDMVTIKYNSSGVEQWVSTFDHDGLHDGGATIGFLSFNTLVVSGPAQTSANHWEYANVSYNMTTGAEISSSVTSSSGSTMDEFSDLAIDEQGNVYLTGSVMNPLTGFFDYKTFKLDADLNIVWEETYAGDAEKHDIARAVGVDGSGNVYVSGFSYNGNGDKDIVTIKYNSSGVEQWTKKYDALSDDEAWDLVIDDEDNIFITGYTTHLGKQDFFTLMYDSAGEALWKARHNGIHNKNDVAKNIRLDGDGNLLVSGLSETSAATTFLTVKYVRHETVIPPDEEPLSTAFYYVENRGQVVDTEQDQVEGLKFYNTKNSPSLYFFDDKISLVLARIDTSTTTQDTTHRVDMGLARGERSTRVMPMDKRQEYYNFYLGHIPEGREQVPLYERLIYPDVFEGIDLMMASNGAGAKYYFICKPGSDPDDIVLEFSGQSGLSTSGGDLIIGTVLQDIVLPEPVAYQIDGNGDPVSVAWTPAYSIDGDEVSISTGTFNPGLSLVVMVGEEDNSIINDVDGNLEWSAWLGGDNSGGFGDDIGMDVKVDGSGNPHVLGSTASATFPTTVGALQENWAKHWDVFLTKFNTEAKIIWSTYYGGYGDDNNVGDDRGVALHTSNDGTVYFAGITESPDFPIGDDPMAPEQYKQDFFGGERDGYIVQLNSNGQRLWATFFGGFTREGIYQITEDGLGNIMIAGILWPATADPWNPVPTVYGEPECDEPTENDGFPGCDSGGFFDDIAAEPDYYSTMGFISKFNNNKELVWSTVFGGYHETWILDLLVDIGDNSFYITGHTNSFIIGDNSTTSPCDASSNDGFTLCDLGGDSYFQDNVNTFESPKMAFIAKFNTDNELLWSTYFGSIGETNEGHKLAINSVGDLYLVGMSRTSASLPNVQCAPPTNGGFPLCDSNPGSSADYYVDKDGINAGADLFISRFDTNKELIWSTFMGGDGSEQYPYSFTNDGTVDIEIDESDNVYILGNSEKSSGDNLPTKAFYDFYDEEHSGPTGTYDVTITSFNANNEQLWMTFYGGSGSTDFLSLDKGHEFDIDHVNKKLYVTGYTNSASFPKICPSSDPQNDGTHCPASIANSGHADAYIGRFRLDYTTNTNEVNKIKPQNLLIYPNPSNEEINIILSGTGYQNTRIQIFNSLGLLFHDIVIPQYYSADHFPIDIRNFPSGIYFLSVEKDGVLQSQKFVKTLK